MATFKSVEPERDMRTLLVIYTGGTIGMLLGEQGYQPEPAYLPSALATNPRFNDPTGDSLFSNSSSVEAWRNHRSSGSGTVTPLPSTGGHNADTPLPEAPTLLVRSTRPVTLPGDSNISLKLSENVYETRVPAFITPSSSTDKPIRYAVLEWQPILDSSNIEAEDWIRLATEIELNYSAYDAFIVLHGTDTICYTSSALSYLLEDLGKTVIITGAQIPLSQLRNDSVDNLLGSLSIAGRYLIPEICLYFNHSLYRGNRCSKSSSFDLDAFSSPNFPSLVNVGTEIVVNWSNILMPRSLRRFRAHKAMCAEVATLRLFPGITAISARTFLAEPIKGVILEAFGAGNAPQRKDLIDAIQEACSRGVVIVAISQCARGSVSADYAAGRSLANAGVVPGADMTPEAALTKLSYLLSKPELSTEDVRKLMGLPLRGELSPPISSQEDMLGDLEGAHGIMSQLLRLSNESHTPSVSTEDKLLSQSQFGLSQASKDATASWSLTASSAATVDLAVLPYVIHLAVSKDDLGALQYCLSTSASLSTLSSSPQSTSASAPPPSSAANLLDPSGRTPLHTAALHGSLTCINLLLQSGGLVHTRDILDHTPLYWAAKMGHYDTVNVLVKAGANLAGADIVQGRTIMKDLKQGSSLKTMWEELLEDNTKV